MTTRRPFNIGAILSALVAAQLGFVLGSCSPQGPPKESKQPKDAKLIHRKVIEFLYEQDGSNERKFKQAIAPVLKAKGIRRAFLLRARFDKEEETVVLGLVGKTDAETIDAISKVFKKETGSSTMLDIMFLDADEEEKASR